MLDWEIKVTLTSSPILLSCLPALGNLQDKAKGCCRHSLTSPQYAFRGRPESGRKACEG